MLGISLFHNTPSFYHHLGQTPKLEGYPGLHLLMRVKGKRNLNKIRITQEIDSTLGTLQIVFSSLQYMRKWQPIPVLVPGRFHGLRSLVGYSPWGCKESDMTEYTHTNTHT